MSPISHLVDGCAACSRVENAVELSRDKRLRQRAGLCGGQCFSNTSITRFGSVYIGVWSTWCDLTFALIRSAMKRCVLRLIMRSSSASRNHEGLVFHAGTGADS